MTRISEQASEPPSPPPNPPPAPPLNDLLFGRLFVSAAVIHGAVAFAVLRALAVRRWWLLPPLELYTAPGEVALLAAALLCAFLTQIAMLLRLIEFKVKYAVLAAIVQTILQSLFILSALISFRSRQKPDFNNNNNYTASQGHVAAIMANIFSFVTLALLVTDAVLNRLSNHNLAKSRRKLIASIIFASWVIAIGGVAFKYIEGWQFEDSFSFAVVTLTTIGYGNVAPKTRGGKLFLIFYFLFGAGVIGFLVSAIQDSMVARAREMLIWRNKIRRERRLMAKAAAASGGGHGLVDAIIVEATLDRSPTMSVPQKIVGFVFPSLAQNYAKAAETLKRRRTLESKAAETLSRRRHQEGIAATGLYPGTPDSSARTVINDAEAANEAEATDLDSDDDDDNDNDTNTVEGTGSVFTSATPVPVMCEIEDVTATSLHDEIEIEEIMRRDMEYRKLFIAGVSIIAWWLIIAYVFYRTESSWSYTDATYFAFVTMTTIGYGDVVPTSPVTWEVWYVYVFVSIALVTLLVTGIGDGLAGRVGMMAVRAQESRRRREEMRRRRRRERDVAVGVVGK